MTSLSRCRLASGSCPRAQQTGASHTPNIAAEGKCVHAVWCFSIMRPLAHAHQVAERGDLLTTHEESMDPNAPIGTDKSEMPLSVLSALSRLDIDPWEEAAELSELPAETATQRLAALIARLPAQTDSRVIASRLIKLLPRRSNAKGQVAEKVQGPHAMTGSTFTIILLCAAFVAIALIFAASRQPASLDDQADRGPQLNGPVAVVRPELPLRATDGVCGS